MATIATTPDGTDVTGRRIAFLGHPKGLALSRLHRGVGALFLLRHDRPVVLYMAAAALPGHVEHVAGMAGWRAALETLFDRSPQALASRPSDSTPASSISPPSSAASSTAGSAPGETVIIGTLLMSAGHFASAFDRSFLRRCCCWSSVPRCLSNIAAGSASISIRRRRHIRRTGPPSSARRSISARW